MLTSSSVKRYNDGEELLRENGREKRKHVLRDKAREQREKQ